LKRAPNESRGTWLWTVQPNLGTGVIGRGLHFGGDLALRWG